MFGLWEEEEEEKEGGVGYIDWCVFISLVGLGQPETSATTTTKRASTKGKHLLFTLLCLHLTVRTCHVT